jgi:hypothetical protein
MIIIFNLPKVILILTLVLISKCGISQSDSNNDTISSYKNGWFFSAEIGCQISGIKDEDFIKSNIAPLVSFSVGKWITPVLGSRLGYKGYYFNYIGDNEKHYFTYVYCEVVTNLNNLIKKNRINYHWNVNIHAGPGYFYNNYYQKSNVCGNIGISNSFLIKNNLDVFIDISSIIGWDIYQGDEDILPSINIGLIYTFR